jgi:predicted nucleic-acid-binding Zn-ribbon protein
MAKAPALVTIGRNPFGCHVCQGRLFFRREIKLNTTRMEFLDLGWLNQSATGLVCVQCGYVHLFLSNAVELWIPAEGYPPQN